MMNNIIYISIPIIILYYVTFGCLENVEGVSDSSTSSVIPKTSFCQNGYLINIDAFVDRNLRECVKKQCDVKGEMYCFPNDVSSLDCTDLSVRSLEGMEQISHTDFRHVFLNRNLITDVHPLTNFNISRTLSMENNLITDISPLGTLKNIKILYLAENPIETLGNLESLDKLYDLDITGGKINDLTEIGKITYISSLSLWNNQIVDISALSSLTRLDSLGLSFNQITDITALSKLTKLHALGLSNNQIVDASPLLALSNLHAVNLEGNINLDCESVSNLYDTMVSEEWWNDDIGRYELEDPILKLPDHCK